MNILIVDDEAAIAQTLSPVLSAQGHAIAIAGNAAEALAAAGARPFDLILLDLGLPDADGCEIIARLKQEFSPTIIILSARHLEEDKVRALDEGADDYVDKPFGIAELQARIRAAERRKSGGQRATRLTSRELTVDFAQRAVWLFSEPVKFSPKEFALLELLCRHSGQVVTQRQMMIAGWGSPTVDGQYLRSYVGMLRQKLEYDPAEPELILTEPGVGYRLALAMTPESSVKSDD